jgi:polyisoprenoid-binding protein YceI
MKTLALSLLLGLTLAQADCTFSQSGSVDVTWKAFKTPMKVGVGGHFTDVSYKGAHQNAKDLQALLSGSSVNISVASVDSNNKGRDEKLLNAFFKQMAGPDISATVRSLKSDSGADTGIVTVAVVMNGVTRDVPMKYSYKDNTLSASGVIDLADFKAQAALKSINTACYELHQGKTWSDVEIGFIMPVKAACK